MEEFFTNLHIGWWFLAQTLIILACFISLDRYAYHRSMLFANYFEQLNKKIELLESRTVELIKVSRNYENDYDEDEDY